MVKPLHYGAVILAAGASTRMHQPKQLLPVAGKSLLRHITDIVLASPAWPVVVVLGAQADVIRPEISRLPVLVVENPDWAEGLAASIRAGIRVVDSFSLSLEAALLVLCDQPELSTGILTRLAGEHQRTGKSIVAARYDNHPGPPVLFARRHFHELLELRGPGGARPLFTRHADALATLEFPTLAADLDTPADYHAFLRRHDS